METYLSPKHNRMKDIKSINHLLELLSKESDNEIQSENTKERYYGFGMKDVVLRLQSYIKRNKS